MAKRVKRIKECVGIGEVVINGKKRKKKICEEIIVFQDSWAGAICRHHPPRFNWTKWRRDHPGQQLTLWDVWEGYE